MLAVITGIMDIVFTIFAVYGIFVFRKWHKVAAETESIRMETQSVLREERGADNDV